MERTTLTLGEIIENNVNIFDFEYPFYSEEYRPTFERHFIEHFYFDEIGQETVARFKHRLKIKLNLIMPYWNKIFLADKLEQRILDNYDVTETYEKEVIDNTTQTSNGTVTSTNENTSKNLESDTPVTKTDLDNIDYFSNITKDIANGKNDTTSNNTNNVQNTNKENWTRKIQGNYGVQTDANAIVQYWESLRMIELEIFNQLNVLFMEVY